MLICYPNINYNESSIKKKEIKKEGIFQLHVYAQKSRFYETINNSHITMASYYLEMNIIFFISFTLFYNNKYIKVKSGYYAMTYN